MTAPLSRINPRWNGRDPGAYAVVIGVSQYDHLPGGSGPAAAETYGLPQLKVSALSAYRFFEWLRDRYVCDGIRLAKCWLLLSPTEKERTRHTELGDFPAATFANAATAVREWFAEMRGLDDHTAQASKALFFFSGHGVELYQDEHLLLPADVLAPPLPSLVQSLRTQNLRRGMAGLNVRSQQFFVDACRNDHSRMRTRGLVLRGSDVLPEEGAAWANPDVVAPVIYATSPGAQAYQEIDVAADGSLFAKALHEGVTKPPADIRTTEQGICQVDLYRLVGFMRRHIADQLVQHQSTATQLVNLAGGGIRPPMVTNDVDEATDTAPWPPSVDASREQQQVQSTPPMSASKWRQLRGDSEGTNLFGTKVSFDTWQWHTLLTDEGTPVSHSLMSVVEYKGGTSRLRVQVPDARVPVVLTAGDRTCRIPPLGPDVVLRIDISGSRCVAVDVDDGSPGIVGLAAATWHRYTEGDPLGAAGQTGHLLQEVLDGGSPSPHPALVAALIRLRTDFHAVVGLSTLVELYPQWPDFRILRTEHALRTAAGDEVRQRAAASFSNGFPVPYSVEAFGYLAAQAGAAAESHRLLVDLDQAVAAFQPGGFFCLRSVGP